MVGQVNITDIAQAAHVCPELLAFPENIRRVESFLTTFRAESATIFVAPEHLPSFPDYACRLLHFSDAKLLSLVPDNLRDELLDVMQDGQLLAAAFDGHLPVAFSYVASETETLWDVSVDTLETHRRQGYAAAAVATLIGIMKDKGKTAVWGAVHSNLASQSLAHKLGFVEANELWVLSRVEKEIDFFKPQRRT